MNHPMIRRVMLSVMFSMISAHTGLALKALDTSTVNKSVVFLFSNDSAGAPNTQVATGFLINVPDQSGHRAYYSLITVRHVVDPVWLGCSTANPSRFFVRVNNKNFDPKSDKIGVSYFPSDLIHDGAPTWLKSDDDDVDLAVLPPPPELLSGNYDVIFMNFRNFGKPDEIAKLGVGSQIASSGLVPGLEGKKRNYPVFKFGKIASIPDEEVLVPCPGRPDVKPRALHVWWLNADLIGGNSGSPIYFDPLFPPGGDISAGEPRAMIIGMQSVALPGAALAGMTPASYIIDVISHTVPNDADLTLGSPPK